MSDSVFKDPEVVPFVPCPNCGRLLALEDTRCSHCCELIDDEHRIAGAVYNVVTTQAISLANTIGTGDAGIVVFLVMLAAIIALGFDWLVWCTLGWLLNVAIALVAIGRWYYRFGRYPLADPEFVAAKREMRRSFCLWAAFGFMVLVVNFIWWP